MDDLLKEFLTETAESLDVVDVELVKLEQDPDNKDILGNIFRLVHTIKGTCGFIGLPRLEKLAHAAETMMDNFREGAPVTAAAITLILSSIDRIKEILAHLEAEGREPDGADDELILELKAMAEHNPPPGRKRSRPVPVGKSGGDATLEELEAAFREAGGPGAAAETVAELADPATPAGDGSRRSQAAKSIRVNVDALETLMTMVSELVLTRNQLLDISRREQESDYKVPLQRLSNVTAELQEGVMKTRMQPIGNAWQKLPRIVRDLGHELGKKIELEMQGAETELDRQVLELIRDPLTHMVRNAADHGLEMPDERIASGKPETGIISLSAYHEGGHIIIALKDDGRGLPLEKIREKALRLELASETELAQMSETQILRFIFHPGFSTAANVTNVSGRGVGMDVVRSNIEFIGGSVEIKSSAGAGSAFIVKIPLTLAIVPALIVAAQGQRFALPQISVVELVRVQANAEHKIETIHDTPVLRLRNKLLPLVYLNKLLKLHDGDSDAGGFVVVAQVGSQSFGIVVDAVFHTEEIVVKPMASMLRHLPVFSGNTILGDGSVIMILDPNGVAEALGGETGTEFLAAESSQPAQETEDEGLVSLLIFTAEGDEPKAVALSLVTRLEEIEVDTIERSNGRYMVQYRGGLMPLVFFSDEGRPPETGVQSLLVFTDGDRSMGLAVNSIIDIVEDRLDIEVAAEKPGILGSAIIKGRATEIVDVGYYLPQAFADWFGRAGGNAHRKRSVLLVDDSAFFRNMLAPVLTANGYGVTKVSSAAAALELLAARQFDVVVSDIEMPDMNGFELAETIRANARSKNMPLIALSSNCSPEAVEKGRAAGFNDFVAKFDREGLIVSLRQSQVDVEQAA